MKQHERVTLIYPDQGADDIGCFIVPNAALLVARAPHPEAAKRLIDYLLSTETERKLALSDAGQIPLHPGVAAPPQLRPIDTLKVAKVNYAEVAAKLQAVQPYLKSWLGF
jgi:iron(III) transport system substrate-binding protein